MGELTLHLYENMAPATPPGTSALPLDRLGRVRSGPKAGAWVLIAPDDTGTGGFYLFTSTEPSERFDIQQTFDGWFATLDDLARHLRESALEVAWTDQVYRYRVGAVSEAVRAFQAKARGKIGREVARGVFVSADGGRRFRVDAGSVAGHHGTGPHVHLELLEPVAGEPGRSRVVSNNHIPMERAGGP